MDRIVPYLNKEYYTIQQIAHLTGWSTHNVSQRARACQFERVAPGVYTKESVDRYLLARRITREARQDGYTPMWLLWPDESGRAEWNGMTYPKK